MNHIVLATVACVDMLVSWNFKHRQIRQNSSFNAVNIENGFKQSKFLTREVADYGKEI